MQKYIVIFFILINSFCHSQTIKILFNATKAEMAGNADWVIDADVYNLGTNFNGAMVPGGGSDANPQNIPTPTQNNIDSFTEETYWSGALSYWAIDLVKQGYEIETLPNNDSITYGNVSHQTDLSNYNVFVIAEPNILFSLSQKNAIINFVQNGGGLFMISDHDISDRDGDGYDSPFIWNDLFSNNSIQINPFGITFDFLNFSQSSSNIANLPEDSCLHGILGNVTELQFNNGTSMKLDTVANPSVQGLIFRNGALNTGINQVMFTRARFGNGKVCAIGDSSPSDDGTGDQNDFLYYSYKDEANGSHQRLLVNATVWLASNSLSNGFDMETQDNFSFSIYPNPSTGIMLLKCEFKKKVDFKYEIYDLTGRIVFQKEKYKYTSDLYSEEIVFQEKGFYLLRFISSGLVITKSIVVN